MRAPQPKLRASLPRWPPWEMMRFRRSPRLLRIALRCSAPTQRKEPGGHPPCPPRMGCAPATPDNAVDVRASSSRHCEASPWQSLTPRRSIDHPSKLATPWRVEPPEVMGLLVKNGQSWLGAPASQSKHHPEGYFYPSRWPPGHEDLLWQIKAGIWTLWCEAVGTKLLAPSATPRVTMNALPRAASTFTLT
jgi:hypothetical protein